MFSRRLIKNISTKSRNFNTSSILYNNIEPPKPLTGPHLTSTGHIRQFMDQYDKYYRDNHSEEYSNFNVCWGLSIWAGALIGTGIGSYETYKSYDKLSPRQKAVQPIVGTCAGIFGGVFPPVGLWFLYIYVTEN